MTAISLDHLIEMVAEVRSKILLDYEVDMGAILHFKNDEGDVDWVVPASCGAFHYRLFREKEDTGGAFLELLPRMPKRDCELTGGGIPPLAYIGAGKCTRGEHLPYLCLKLTSGELDWTYHLQLLPVAMDMLNRFAKQIKSLPADLNLMYA
jgi:hypothetical protein